MLFSNVFTYIESRSANQNLRRSISPSAAPYVHRLCHGDKKSVNATLLIPAIYKCPLPQPLSFDILTNAPGVWGSTSPFLKSYLNSFRSQRAFSRKKSYCKSPVFLALRTLPSSVSCNSFTSHSYENCRVYTNNSHFGSPRVLSRGTFLLVIWQERASVCTSAPESTSHQARITTHESQVTCLPDRLPVPRTCILRTIGAILSLQQTFSGSLFLLFLCGRV